MEEIKFKYLKSSVKSRLKLERIQIIIVIIGLVIGYSFSYREYRGMLIAIPSIACAIALTDILVVIKFEKLSMKYGGKLESVVFILNGLTLLLTALGYQFIGSHRIQYVYYMLAFLNIFILPSWVRKMKEYYVIAFGSDKLTVFSSTAKPTVFEIDRIENISLLNEKITIKVDSKIKNYYLCPDNPQDLDKIRELPYL